MLNVLPETLGQLRALGTVPVKLRSNLELGELIRTNGRHRPNISLSIRCRTTSQSLVMANPASTAAQRRSISAAQAPSTSPSEVERKLLNNWAAISARSCSGRSSALASNSSASLTGDYSSATGRDADAYKWHSSSRSSEHTVPQVTVKSINPGRAGSQGARTLKRTCFPPC